MKNKNDEQRLISSITNGITPTVNQIKQPKKGSMPVLDKDVRLPYVPIKETESAVPANAMGSSAPANPASPIAMPEKLLKKKPKRLNVILRRAPK